MAKCDSNNETKSLNTEEKPYISCIRIHGLRILPPVLTDEKRMKMRYYKELAIQIEEKMNRRRVKKNSTSSNEDFELVIHTESNSPAVSSSSSFSSDEEPTFRSQIFSESCKSDVLKMLNDNPKPAISNVPSKQTDSDIKCFDRDLPSSPPKSRTSPKKYATSLNNDLVTLEKDNISKINESSNFCGAGDINKVDSESYMNSPPPTLIRSNSYTLDTPSPFLQALMKENTESKIIDSIGKKRRSWDLEKAKEKWCSIENDLNIVADKSKNYKRDNFNSLPPSSNTSPEIKMYESRIIKHADSVQFPEKESELPTTENPKQKQNKDNRYIKSFITPVKIFKKTEIILKNPSEIILPRKPEILNEKSERYIREIIDKINDEQSKQMAELIARQKKEQDDLMKFFAEQQAMLFSKLRNTYQDEKHEKINEKVAANILDPTKNDITIVSEADILKNSETLLFECKKLQQETLSLRSESSSQTLFCTSLSSPEDTITNSLKSLTPSPETISSKIIVESLSRFSNSFSVDSLEPICNGSQGKNYNSRRTSSCSRQLFPTKQQIWAANKINAMIRGYLVRRLLKTDRVQNLIKTIKDTLACAMQLHLETAENIQPADVELHRRLIQQVTAACYTFHDTFFELSKSEQLQIIALDRQIQKEKLLRPASAKSNTSLSLTTQKVIERKMRRSSDSFSGSQSRTSSSRSFYSNNEFRVRAKSLGISDSMQNGKKTSPSNDVIRQAMNFGTNKKPWR